MRRRYTSRRGATSHVTSSLGASRLRFSASYDIQARRAASSPDRGTGRRSEWESDGQDVAAAMDEKGEVIRVRSAGRAGRRLGERLSRANSPGLVPRVMDRPRLRRRLLLAGERSLVWSLERGFLLAAPASRLSLRTTNGGSPARCRRARGPRAHGRRLLPPWLQKGLVSLGSSERCPSRRARHHPLATQARERIRLRPHCSCSASLQGRPTVLAPSKRVFGRLAQQRVLQLPPTQSALGVAEVGLAMWA